MNPTEITDLTSLIINEVDSQETFKQMQDNDLVKENELYLVLGEPEVKVDQELTAESENAISSKAVYEALQEKVTGSLVQEIAADEPTTEEGKEEEEKQVPSVTAIRQILGDFDQKNSVTLEGGGVITLDNFSNEDAPEEGEKNQIEITPTPDIVNVMTPFIVKVDSNQEKWVAEMIDDIPTGYYYQEIEVSLMKEVFNPFCDWVREGNQLNSSKDKQIQDQWNYVQKIETFDGRIRIWTSKLPNISYKISLNIFGIEMMQFADADNLFFPYEVEESAE